MLFLTLSALGFHPKLQMMPKHGSSILPVKDQWNSDIHRNFGVLVTDD